MRVTGAADSCTLTTQPFLAVRVEGCQLATKLPHSNCGLLAAATLQPLQAHLTTCNTRPHVSCQANAGNLPLAVPRCGPPTLPPDAADGYEMAWADALGPARIHEVCCRALLVARRFADKTPCSMAHTHTHAHGLRHGQHPTQLEWLNQAPHRPR